MWYIEYEDQKYYSVNSAMESLKKDFSKAYLNYHDDLFGQYDWTIEPSESFETLKYQRAKQIRESYDYVRIFASYAADSGTVINTFLKHNFLIDEIVNHVSKWENSLTDLEQEHHTLFVPKIKDFLKETRKTIITVSEMTADNVFEMMHLKNEDRSSIVPTRYSISHVSKKLLLDKNFIDLYAECKPHLYIDKGKFYTNFSLPYVHDLMSRPNTIDFFTSPDFPKLHIKQCHILKNAVKKHFTNLILDSYKHVIHINEGGSDRIKQLMPDLVMETFIEDHCRDFNDFGLTPSVGVKSSQPISGGLNVKEQARVSGFYNSNKSLLTDYLDFVKDFFKLPLFEFENKKLKKVTLKTKTYDLGK